MKTEKILLAGATGYLGGYILAELLKMESTKISSMRLCAKAYRNFVYVSVWRCILKQWGCPKSSKHYFSKLKSNIFQILFYWKSVVLGSVVGAICKSPFMNKTFRTAWWVYLKFSSIFVTISLARRNALVPCRKVTTGMVLCSIASAKVSNSSRIALVGCTSGYSK